MKIVFHPRYHEVYASDPAATQGRLQPSEDLLKGKYEFVQPEPAKEKDILLVHTPEHLERIKQRSHLHELALLAAGGAIKASELAIAKEPAFGLIRPPGHHASRDSCWGFCWYNNMAIAVEKLRVEKRIEKAVIVDIDLHFGDGTKGFFASSDQVSYYHLGNVWGLEEHLNSKEKCDLVGISAGFDRHASDWGGILSTDDYREIGRMIREFSQMHCPEQVFAVLEGGYNHQTMAESILALIKGLEG